MDDGIAKLLHERAVPPTTLLLYLYMRADIARNSTPAVRLYKSSGQLVSGLDVPDMAVRVGEPALTIERRLQDLRRRGWIRAEGDFWMLGVVDRDEHELLWLVDTKDEEVASDAVAKVKARAAKDSEEIDKAERRAKINKDTAKDLTKTAVMGPEKKAVPRLRKRFANHYWEQYSERLPELDGNAAMKKSNAQLARVLEWCAKDEAEVAALIDFLFARWGALRKALHVPAERPSIGLLATKLIFAKVREWNAAGIPGTGEEEDYASGRETW